MRRNFIRIPELVRIKPGALERLGVYLSRFGFKSVLLMTSDGLLPELTDGVERGLSAESVRACAKRTVQEASVEAATHLVAHLPSGCRAVVGLGGGKALDTAKYVASLIDLPYFAVPTSLSNDGFCSPQSSLLLEGKRRSLPAAMPFGVVVDTDVCLRAPKELWCSGVGDLAAKVTAVRDWKIAFHEKGTPVDDFAALLSDATVFQFMANPTRDAEGVRLLATALMLNGIGMEIAGSSRPASGSEHLISHALDRISSRPRLHGLQVGTATYIVARLQDNHADRIADLFTRTGFWDAVSADPFSRDEWLDAVKLAPTLKDNFHTVLNSRRCLPEVERLTTDDSYLKPCFR